MDEIPPPLHVHFVPLSPEGCHLPVPAVAFAKFIRERLYQAMLATIPESDVETREALLVACNLHPLASWWIQNRRAAQTSIAETMLKLQSARRNAENEFRPAERETEEH